MFEFVIPDLDIFHVVVDTRGYVEDSLWCQPALCHLIPATYLGLPVRMPQPVSGDPTQSRRQVQETPVGVRIHDDFGGHLVEE